MDNADGNELFSTVLVFAAQAGFAADVAPAALTCRATLTDERLWELLLSLRLRPSPLGAVLCTAVNAKDAAPGVVGGAGEGADNPGAARRRAAVDRAVWLLARGADPNRLVGFDATPLHFAVALRDYALLSAVLEAGADPDNPGDMEPRIYPLELAIEEGVADAVEALLAAGASPRIRARHRPPLLHQVCSGPRCHRVAVAQALVRAGCTPSTRSRDGLTALHAAAVVGDAALIAYFLSLGASVHEVVKPRNPRARGGRAGDGGHDTGSESGGGGDSDADDDDDSDGDNVTAAATGPTVLELAVRSGGEDAILELLAAGAVLPPLWGPEGDTEPPLITACTTCVESAGVVAAMLARGADPNARRPCNPGGKTVLHVAARLCDDATVALLIAHGADVHSVAREVTRPDRPGGAPRLPQHAPPLHHAVCAGNSSTVVALLAAGANVAGESEDGLQPLHWACRQWDGSYTEVVRTLLAAGAQPWARCALGRTALHWACLEGTPEVVRALLRLPGADVNDPAHPTPARVASCFHDTASEVPLTAALMSSHQPCQRPHEISRAICHLLLRRGADPNRGACHGLTPLGRALVNRWGCVAMELLRRGADAHAKTGRGTSMLHLACNGDGLDDSVMTALLGAGCDVNAGVGDDPGVTPLWHALQHSRADLAGILLAAGAALTPPPAWSTTPLLHMAARLCTPALVSELMRRGADPHARDDKGLTPLHAALDDARFQRKPGKDGEDDGAAVVIALLAGGAEANAADKRKRTPLLLAVSGRREGAALALLERGADPRLADGAGDTPLHEAVHTNASPALVGALLERGADATARDRSHRTALTVALRQRASATVLEMLLARGGGAQLPAGELSEMLCAAVDRGHVAGVTALVDHGATATDACHCHDGCLLDWVGSPHYREFLLVDGSADDVRAIAAAVRRATPTDAHMPSGVGVLAALRRQQSGSYWNDM